MADDVQLPGTGENISAEEVTTLNGGSVSARKIQRVGLALVTADSTAVDCPGDSTNGQDVDVTRLPALVAGTATIGSVLVGSLPATPAGTNTVGTVLSVGSVAHDGVATAIAPVLVGGYASAAAPSDISADGDSVRAWYFRNGAQAVVITAAGALVGGDAANGMDVDVTRLPALVAGTASIGTVGLATGTNTVGTVLVAGTSTVAGTVTASNATGNEAHDSTDSGNPVKIGYKAVAHGANPTAVAASDRTDAYANRHGVLFVIGGHPNPVTIEFATTGAATDTAIVTVSTGSKIVVTQAQILADNANTAFPQARLGFGTANTPTTTGVVATHPGIPAGGGVSRGDGSGILGVGADNEDLRFTCGAPTGGSLRVLVTYFTIES